MAVDIAAILTASIDDFKAKMAEADASVKGLQESSSSNFSKLQSIGKGALLGVGAAVGVVAVASVDLASKFQSTVSSIAANANISTAAAQKIGAAFLGTAGTTIYSGQQIGQAYAAVAGQLGATQGHALDAAQAMTVMKAAMDLAEGSGTDLNTATSVLAATMQAFGDKAGKASQVSDVLFNTSRTLGVGVSAVGGEFTKLHSTLGAVTPSIGQLGGILIDLTEHGETGRKALAAVNTSLNGLLVPSAAATKAQAELGVSFVNSQGQFVGMSGVISELQPKLAGMTQVQQLAELKAIGMGSANKALLTTILAGPAAFDAATAAASRVGGAHAAAEKQSQTFQHQVETLKAQFEDYGVVIGQKLIPILEHVASVVAKVIEWFTKHKTAAEAVGIAIAVLVAGPIAAYIGGMVAAAAATIAAAAPWLAIIALAAAVGLAVYEVVKHWGAIVNFFKKIWEDVEHIFLVAIDDIVGFVKRWWPEILGIVTGGVGLLVGLLIQHWSQIEHDVLSMINDVVGFFTALPGKIVDALGDIVSTIWAAFTTANQWIVDHVITPVITTFTGLPSKIVSALGAIVSFIWQNLLSANTWILNNVIQPVVNLFTQLPGQILSGLGDIVGFIFSGLLSAGSWVWANVVVPIWNEITGIPGSIAKAFSTFISDIFSDIGNVADWVDKNIVQPVVNAIKSIPSKIGQIGGQILGDITGGLGGAASGAFHAVFGAAGGIINKPTLLVAGEAGPEALLPLNDTQRAMQILGFPGSPLGGSLTGISSVPPSAASSTPSGGGDLVVNFNLDGITLYTKTFPALQTVLLQNKRTMVTLGLA